LYNKKHMKKILLLIVVVLLSSCDKEVGIKIDELSKAESLWESQSVGKDYQYILSIEPNGAEPIDYQVKVESGKSSFEIDRIERLGTIEGIFSYSREVIKNRELEVLVEYDASLGFPELISVRHPTIIDASYDLRVTNFSFL